MSIAIVLGTRPEIVKMSPIIKELEKRKLRIPVLIGGATTSKIHTAVKIDPEYSGAVIHVPDASRSIEVLNQLTSGDKKADFIRKTKTDYDQLREKRLDKQMKAELIPLVKARDNKFPIDWNKYRPAIPKRLGIKQFKNITRKPITNKAKKYLNTVPPTTPLFPIYTLLKSEFIYLSNFMREEFKE